MNARERRLVDPARRPDVRSSSGRRAMRWVWLMAGHGAMGLGLVGAVVPVMPTTCFVLLAAACYARGSDRFHRRLLAHRVFGPMIRDWREHRSMAARTKAYAVGAVLVSITASMLLVPRAEVRLVLALIAVVLVTGLLLVPTRQACRSHLRQRRSRRRPTAAYFTAARRSRTQRTSVHNDRSSGSLGKAPRVNAKNRASPFFRKLRPVCLECAGACRTTVHVFPSQRKACGFPAPATRSTLTLHPTG